MLSECGGLDLLRESGWLKLFRTAEAFENSATEQRYLENCDIEFDRLGATDIKQMESGLSSIFAGGLWIKNTASVSSPGQVCELYASKFADEGGTVVLDELEKTVKDNQSQWSSPLVHGQKWCLRTSDIKCQWWSNVAITCTIG